MSATRLHRNEVIGIAGAILLVLGVFLPWYTTDDANRNSAIDGERGSLSCWEVHPVLRWLLLLAALAPFILAYIVVTDQQLSWARGEMTLVTSMAAFGLILYNGVIDRPGSVAISLGIGWFLSLAGSLLMLAGATMRSSEVERARKPPGTV